MQIIIKLISEFHDIIYFFVNIGFILSLFYFSMLILMAIILLRFLPIHHTKVYTLIFI